MIKTKPNRQPLKAVVLKDTEADLLIQALDLYSRIWLGQYTELGHVMSYAGYETAYELPEKTNGILLKIRSLLIPQLDRFGKNFSASLGIFGDTTDVRAKNAYGIQTRLRHDLAWFREPDHNRFTVDFYEPSVKGDLYDFDTYCEKADDTVFMTLYVTDDHIRAMASALNVYTLTVFGNFSGLFRFYTDDQSAIDLAKRLDVICKNLPVNNDIRHKKLFVEETISDKLHHALRSISHVRKKDIRKTVYPPHPYHSDEWIIGHLPQDIKSLEEWPGSLNEDYDYINDQDITYLTTYRALDREYGGTKDYLIIWPDKNEHDKVWFYMGDEFRKRHNGILDFSEDVSRWLMNRDIIPKYKNDPH